MFLVRPETVRLPRLIDKFYSILIQSFQPEKYRTYAISHIIIANI